MTKKQEAMAEYINSTITWGFGTLVALVILPVALPLFLIGAIARKLVNRQ